MFSQIELMKERHRFSIAHLWHICGCCWSYQSPRTFLRRPAGVFFKEDATFRRARPFQLWLFLHFFGLCLLSRLLCLFIVIPFRPKPFLLRQFGAVCATLFLIGFGTRQFAGGLGVEFWIKNDPFCVTCWISCRESGFCSDASKSRTTRSKLDKQGSSFGNNKYFLMMDKVRHSWSLQNTMEFSN